MKNLGLGWAVAVVFALLLVYQWTVRKPPQETSEAAVVASAEIPSDDRTDEPAEQQLQRYREEVRRLGEENSRLRDRILLLESGTTLRGAEVGRRETISVAAEIFPVDTEVEPERSGSLPLTDFVTANVEARTLETEGRYWDWAYTVRISNDHTRDVKVGFKVQFLGADGYQVGSQTYYTEVIPARSERVFRGKETIDRDNSLKLRQHGAGVNVEFTEIEEHP